MAWKNNQNVWCVVMSVITHWFKDLSTYLKHKDLDILRTKRYLFLNLKKLLHHKGNNMAKNSSIWGNFYSLIELFKSYNFPWHISRQFFSIFVKLMNSLLKAENNSLDKRWDHPEETKNKIFYFFINPSEQLHVRV